MQKHLGKNGSTLLSKVFGLWLYCHLNNPIQFIFKEVVSLLDTLQLITADDQRSGIDLIGLDEGENLVTEGHHGDNDIGTNTSAADTSGIIK